MAASIDFHDRFGEPELTALGCTATINDQAARGQQRSLKW
jgi:hypothetical protein